MLVQGSWPQPSIWEKNLRPLCGTMFVATVLYLLTISSAAVGEERLGAMPKTEELASVLRDYPGLSDCPTVDAAGHQQLRIEDINSYDAFGVCLFHLFSDLGSPAAVATWMRAEGFATPDNVRHSGYSRSRMQEIGRPEDEGAGVMVIGTWDSEQKGPYFRSPGLLNRLVSGLVNTQQLTAIWFADGTLAEVGLQSFSK